MLGWRSGTSISASSFWNFVGDKLDVVDAGLATPLMAATFAFFRSFTSPSGQRWQYPHSLPRMQPWGFQYQAQGLHSTPCRREPGVSAPLRGESSDASEALSLSSTSFPTFLLKARDVTGSFGGSLPSAPDTPDELGLSSSPPSTRLAQLLSISIFFEQVPVSRAKEATTNQNQKQTSWLHALSLSLSRSFGNIIAELWAQNRVESWPPLTLAFLSSICFDIGDGQHLCRQIVKGACLVTWFGGLLCVWFVCLHLKHLLKTCLPLPLF